MAAHHPSGVAVVTGAARRLGRQIALRLARDTQLDVVVHCNRSVDDAEEVAELVRAHGKQSVVAAADLSTPESAACQIFDTAKSLGAVRVLINSAAVFDEATLPDVTEEHCLKQFGINAIAPLLLSRELAASVAQQDAGSGQIVNILDWRASRPEKGHLAYTASKAALQSMTLGLAQQLAPRIRVNAISPGAMLPPPGQDDWHNTRAAESIPLQRTGHPDDICDAVLYLLNAHFVTGEIHHVSGGEQL